MITKHIDLFIEKAKEKRYFTMLFVVPENVSSMTIKYSYERHKSTADQLHNTTTDEINIVDFALLDQNQQHVGSSGSDRNEITISERFSSDGYTAVPLTAGEWQIVVGAYKIADDGVNVQYDIEFVMKELVLLKGDLHMHSRGSDGVLSVSELADTAVINGLDFISITDHNNFSQNFSTQNRTDLTILPGVELTNYTAHVNFIGVKQPYSGKFSVNCIDDLHNKISQAQLSGAIVSLNHPFDEPCGIKYPLDELQFDCVELWNSMLFAANEKCRLWWHEQLCKGRKLPIIGGSDFHRNDIGSGVGFPCTFLYSLSNGQSDICAAIRAGHAFIGASPSAPLINLKLGAAIMGDSADITAEKQCAITLNNLKSGDEVRIISDSNTKIVPIEKHYLEFFINYDISTEAFLRVEIYRSLAPGLPKMIQSISNPMYFSN